MSFCASADDALYLYKILQNGFNTYEVIERNRHKPAYFRYGS